MLLSELAEKLKAKLTGGGEKTIVGVNTIQDAAPDQVCFLTSAKHAKGLAGSRAAAVITDKPLPECLIPQLVVDNVNKALITAMELFAPKLAGFGGIHPTAVIEPSAQIDKTAAVGPGAYISHGVKIGAHTVIGPGCKIGEKTVIGMHCRLDANVVVYHNCQIGNFCIIQANSTIGSTGFGYAFIDGQHRLIPHNGGVILEDGVEIGANSCVDRAKFGNTIIGAGTKIDNLVQIAHNVRIGRLCLLAGQVGIAGSTVLGNGVAMGGQSGIIDNIILGDGAMVCAKSAVTENVPPGQAVLGMPPQEMHRELKCVAIYQRLPELAKELKELRQRVKQLESAENH
ncbi:MAG TPA: UDP-3-O-(3-hydroxymyristoyl)glucosamine N-acyltransferase [Anaerohalosphaeraceae bacterium]|nr:UDP-3-O-(3-hydroxymyristoyl)glucosamine N-acyltransferase [Anaerohalosphaeraceae bacterium]HOL30997.1 UDP-3-O-(3-hydroxymyristoyl)glucosamine N-acyltransferase [Anaerohalosphaeraceae bacterium]HOM76099.1 UDP-3-O-(3-hydroxymyristoyl)glucosamine N-acyltransferase [Anaerohalosphaeraceae bacterium]HPC63358.1 UDP-3-O-(3-hydroxymyristoyl)glucosamine N-acyltransferase [Anaerohalosphaeraceae bacterium]HPO69095.1 UDP-3-O-(3-hydroxymyristoyl)glucosamine N-acyltransferase [Anaerohalosphaeraceae bacteri